MILLRWQDWRYASTRHAQNQLLPPSVQRSREMAAVEPLKCYFSLPFTSCLGNPV